MDFRFVARPAALPLSRYVESIWCAAGRVPYRRERILPNGRLVLMFNLGAAFRVDAAGYPGGGVLTRDDWLVGLHDNYLINEPLAETNVVGVTFRPWGATALVPAQLRELANTTVEARAVLGSGITRLRQQLGELPAPAARLDRVEHFLQRRLLERERILSPVQYAVSRLASSEPPNVSILARDLGISRKHLNTLFNRHVGLPAKAFARIYRFNAALRQMGALRPLRLERVAADCGYYDQAHFNRDFAAFAGVSPLAYRAQRARYYADSEDDSGLFVPID